MLFWPVLYVQKSGTCVVVAPRQTLFADGSAFWPCSASDNIVVPGNPDGPQPRCSFKVPALASKAIAVMGNVIAHDRGRNYADAWAIWPGPSQAWFAFVLQHWSTQYLGQGPAVTSADGGWPITLLPARTRTGLLYAHRPGHAGLPSLRLLTVGPAPSRWQASQLGFVPRMEVQHTSEKGGRKSLCRRTGVSSRRDDPRPRLGRQTASLRHIANSRRYGDHLHPWPPSCRRRSGAGAGYIAIAAVSPRCRRQTLVFPGVMYEDFDGGWFRVPGWRLRCWRPGSAVASCSPIAAVTPGTGAVLTLSPMPTRLLAPRFSSMQIEGALPHALLQP